MPERKSTPDILGSLLDRPASQKASEPAQPKDSTPEKLNTSKTAQQNTSPAPKTKKPNTSKPAQPKVVLPVEPKAVTPAQPNTDETPNIEAEKTKATFYLAEEVVEALDEAHFRLRRASRGQARRAISKSEIVEAALRLAVEEIEAQGEAAFITQRLR